MDSQLTTPIVTDDETESALVYLGPRGSDDSPSQNPPSHYHLTRDTPNEFVERTPGLTTDESQNGYGTDGSAWSDEDSPPLPANGSGQVEIVDVITENVPSPGHLQMSTVDLISSQSQDDSSQSQGGSQKAKGEKWSKYTTPSAPQRVEEDGQMNPASPLSAPGSAVADPPSPLWAGTGW